METEKLPVLMEGTPEFELFRACRIGDSGLVNELLRQKKADKDFQDGNNDNLTALHHAIQKGHAEVVRLLVEAGADINLKTAIIQQTPLHFAATENLPNSEEIIRTLAKSSHWDVNARDRYGKTALHYASMSGFVDLMKLLLELGSDVNIQETILWTPLHWTCFNGHVEATRVLLEANAHTEMRESDSWTPLHWATMKTFPDIVELLLKAGASSSPEDAQGQAPLFISTLSCMGQKTEDCARVIELLLDAGADINHAGCIGWTALHRLAERENRELLKRLLVRGANPDAQNIGGESPLHLCTASANIPNIRILLAGKASMDVRDLEWKTPFQVALDSIKPEVLKPYLGAGASTKIKMMDVENMIISGEIAKICSPGPCPVHLHQHCEDKTDKTGIVEILHLLHQACLLSSTTTKRMIGLCKREMEVASLKCMARTYLQLYMTEHTTEAYGKLGLPPILQRYLAYEE